MRLELEQNHSSITFAEDAVADRSQEDRTAESSQFLREGIKAAQSGNRAAARTALLKAAELDPMSESAWLWLSSISEYPEELLVFLTNVLEINPLNARALEWSAATRSLLAKNFVQRGIDAAESNQQETAAQHFNQALEYDEKNSMAWLWLASLSESNEGKLSYLEKVLEFDPENETAKAGYEAARNSIRTDLLTEARAAAVSGKTDEAEDLLNAILAEEPNAEDAWVLRSHLANGFDAKIAAFKRVLEINPENASAKAGLESLTSIMDAVAATAVVETVEPVEEVQAAETLYTEEVVQEDLAQPEFDETPSSKFDEQEETVWEPVEESTGELMTAASPFDSFADVPTEEEPVEPVFAEEVEAPNFEALHTDEEANETPVEFTADAEEFVEVQELDHQFESEVLTEVSGPETETEVAEPEAAFVHEDEQPVMEFDTVGSEEPEAVYEDLEAITAPAVNPFDGEEFKNEVNGFETIIAVDVEAPAAVQTFELKPIVPVAPSETQSAFDVPFDATMYGAGKIPMPFGDPAEEAETAPTGYETRLVESPAFEEKPLTDFVACSFCSTENDIQSIACQGCLSVLTLADLEMILANHHADKAAVRLAVEKMESERSGREFSEAELTTLGIGHLNLRNLQYGYNYLLEASQKNPNNVVLSGQVNALLIRLDEIRQQDEAHESMTKGKTILVVDDSPTVRKLIAGKLEKCGHEVICSSDGVEAMEQLESLRPDLVLLDITMPRMDGYQVCKLIRNNVATKDVPVVMISGKDGFFDKVRGRMAGTSGYITKPFGPETLMKAVESYLKQEHVAVEV